MEEAAFLAGVSNATAVDHINSAIIFGEYGTGKTNLGASAGEVDAYGPVLIVDIEGSVAGVGRRYPDAKVVKADTFQKLEAIRYELLNKKHPFKTVVFDTLNVAQDRAESHFKAKPENQTNKFGTYADLKEWTVDFMREMHHADFLAIFIAHPNVVTDEQTGKITTTVKITGSAKTIAPTIPDLIGYLEFVTNEEGEVVRVLRVGRSANIITKNRFGLPDVILPEKGTQGPTISQIHNLINEAKENN